MNRKLSILILGSLGPNQDRIGALSNLGHRLVYAYTEFHPNLIPLERLLPCTPVPRKNLAVMIEYLIAKYGVNVIYSLLNSHDQSTEVTLELIDSRIATPIVRHYKEHPCVPTLEEKRTLTETAAQIYINRPSFDYFERSYGVKAHSAHILDADMISARHMGRLSPNKLRLVDGRPHILVAGGLSTLNDRFDMRELCVEMHRRRIHVHLYGHTIGRRPDGTIISPHLKTRETYERLAQECHHVHLHDYILPEHFAESWSVYDVGFMHARTPEHAEEWQFERLNMPYRYSAYLAAALPIALHGKGQEAMQAFVASNNIGFSFQNYEELAALLEDEKFLGPIASNVARVRGEFTFDHCAEKLSQILCRYAA